MFTGIIKHLGVLKKIEKNHIIIEINHKQNVEIGYSIACNGVCLTVVKIENNLYSFDLAQETLYKTNLSQLQINDIINIEFAARFGDKIDGHIVNGHVYGVGIVENITQNENGWIFSFTLPPEIFKYIDYKASICINGISLTISNLNIQNHNFEANILPFTFEHTNLQNLKVGNHVNIEPDIFAIYTMGIMKRNIA